jgi:hypothetical protein
MGLDQFMFVNLPSKPMLIANPHFKPGQGSALVLNVRTGQYVGAQSNSTPTNTWRKYYELHNYMESIWMSRKAERYVAEGKTEEFNQEPLMLSEHDLNNLEACFKSQDDDFDNEEIVDDDDDVPNKVYYRQANKQILKIARAFKAKGFEIEYNSWW